ncbi:MAG: NAD(P)/FAD-dependent oxidoreductase, partial [Acidobacteria bacterium]|nr:NAD(P)/FAD-dependent oxidoreductase [Acidobacteriota bacterium]
TLVEGELLGGECSYWACMPSKALLRPTEALAAARRAPGAAEAVTGALDAERVFWWRDQITGGLDSSQEAWLAGLNVELVRGTGRVVRPGLVQVGDRDLPYDKLVIATGSSASFPPIPGLADTDFWTNREATTTREVPESLIVLGGGVVGSELAQFFNRLGSRVTVVQDIDHLLPRDDPDAGRLLQELLEEEGIEVRLSTLTQRVDRTDSEFRLHLPGGEVLAAERLLVATGRKPNVHDLGFEQLGLTISKRGIEVDEGLRAAENVWAIGDVTGIALFTHVGKYQARIAAQSIAGGDARADYRAVPAVAFTDPQIASVGTFDGEGLVSSTWKVSSTARASTYERPKRPGFLKVFADPERRVLVGAAAVGPEAGEWLRQLTLAIRAEVPVDVLRDTIQLYPTFSEAVFFAVRDLPLPEVEREPATLATEVSSAALAA